MLERFCRPGARWLLDDGFRDGELDFLREWQQRKQCVVAGIWPTGKGLAMGIVKSKDSLEAQVGHAKGEG